MIYDLNGNLISTILDEEQNSGWHEVQWYGLDHSGVNVPAGVYISKITSGKESETFKIMFLK